MVVFQHLDGQITGRIAMANALVSLQLPLDIGDSVFYLMPVIDMYVAEAGVFALLSFVRLDDGVEQFFHSAAVLEDRRHHRNAKQFAKLVVVNMVSAFLRLVIHVQGANHAYVHVDELGGQIEVALQV